MTRMFVTVGGLGLIPVAPGTWASLATVPLAWLLHWVGGFWLVAAATVALFALGLWASKLYLGGRQEDPQEIVIDEVVGQLIALWPLSFGLTYIDAPGHIFPYPGWIGGFLMFRLFDILKPPPVSWADGPGALGVMLDDVVAGILAGAAVALAAGLAHGWI